jgi:hypothetical protein
MTRPRGPAYDWRDHPDSGDTPPCDRCRNRARWIICIFEGEDVTDFRDWTSRGFACGHHLHCVLDHLEWGLDAVMLYDLAQIPDGGC